MSAIFETSIMEVREASHSMNVSRRFLEDTTVTGPEMDERVCLV